jgi:hypothetical protein
MPGIQRRKSAGVRSAAMLAEFAQRAAAKIQASRQSIQRAKQELLKFLSCES